MGDCGVCLGGDGGDYDPSGFFFREDRKARKEHVCCECRRTIAKGETYENVYAKHDGNIWTDKTCAECAEIADAFYCDGRIYDRDLWNQIRDYIFPEMTTGCLDRLTTARAKEKLLGEWRKWKGVAA